jgi:hypothetical protein
LTQRAVSIYCGVKVCQFGALRHYLYSLGRSLAGDLPARIWFEESFASREARYGITCTRRSGCAPAQGVRT